METAVVSQLIDQYGMDVMRFCRSLTRCACDAEDLYQQTFLKPVSYTHLTLPTT